MKFGAIRNRFYIPVACAVFVGASAFADTSAVEPPVPPSAQKMIFSRACEPGEKLVIGSVGDILPQSGLSEQAYASKNGFESLWSKLTPLFLSVDMMYGNLEGPTAEGVSRGGRPKPDPGPRLDLDVYTATAFSFNYHPRIIDDLQRSGFDILSIANNHSLDRGALGVDRTIDAFAARGLPAAGARKLGDLTSPIFTIVEKKGFRIAWIACSEAMNSRDSKMQVTSCTRNEPQIIKEIQRLFQDRSVDAIIVAPHWGDEYKHIAASRQRVLARKFLEAGASAIIGSHPHMLQEAETYQTKDGRDTVIAYSLGNFVSAQGKTPGLKITALFYVGFTKRDGERAWVNGVSYIPLWMDRGPHSINIAANSKQAPQKVVRSIVGALIDPSREVKPSEVVRTDLGCF